MTKHVRYAVMRRTSGDDATVMESRDGFHWNEICTCAPEWAEEIAHSLESMHNEHAAVIDHGRR